MDSSFSFDACGTFHCLRGVNVSRLVLMCACYLTVSVAITFVLCVATLMSLDHTNKGFAVMLYVVGFVLSLNSVFLHLTFV